MIQIRHGIKLYKGNASFEIPEKFEEFIDNTIERWNIQINNHILMFRSNYQIQSHAVFSIGYEAKNDIWVITILNPFDFFKEKIVKDILCGRIDKMLGRRKNVYKTMPKFILTIRICERCNHWNERKDLEVIEEIKIDDPNATVRMVKVCERFGICENKESTFKKKLTYPHQSCEKYFKRLNK